MTFADYVPEGLFCQLMRDRVRVGGERGAVGGGGSVEGGCVSKRLKEEEEGVGGRPGES